MPLIYIGNFCVNHGLAAISIGSVGLFSKEQYPMTKYETTSLIISAIGSAGVIFLVWQVWRIRKEDRHRALDQTYIDYANMTQLPLQKPDLNEHVYQCVPNFLNLDPKSRDFYNYTLLVFGCFERLFIDHAVHGIANEKMWRVWKLWICDRWFTHPLFTIFWENEGRYFYPDFADFVTELFRDFQQLHHHKSGTMPVADGQRTERSKSV